MKRSIINSFITFRLLFFGIVSTFLIQTIDASYPYYGTKIGALTQLHHAVSGDVYAVDSRTLFLKNFNYDGEAPAAYFYVGNTDKPSNDGWRLRDEKGSTTAITKRYRNKDITLSLPEGKTLRDLKWFSFWCDEFAVNFGDVRIPANLDYPKPQKISALKGVHNVGSDNIVIVDAQTLLIPNFSYDGSAPDAKFWVGRGSKPSPQGLRIPDENGKENPLRQYDKKTIVLTLPGDLTVFDIGHFGVWCEAFTVDFGHIRIPDGLNVPPSLKMLGISPQSKLNCEVLYDDLAFEVRWAVAGESIVVQLVAKLENDEYMSFGISPKKTKTEMIGADVVVAWVDKATGKGFAQDYYLDDKSQCSGTRGSCPDIRLEEKTNSIRLLNAAMVNGYSIVTYQRSLKASDKYDLPIPINGSQAIAWAIGPLNQRNEVSFHSKYTKGDQLIDFGRQPTWNCPQPEPDRDSKQESEEVEEYYDSRPQSSSNGGGNRRNKPQSQESNREQPQSEQLNGRPRKPVPTPKPVSKRDAWDIPPIQCNEPEDGVFYAQLGPTGGKHGYPAITGHVGWGISWYINGLLIPEIHVVRGKTYRFVTEGGNDPEFPAKYHPFYITDDPIGGYEHKTEEEKNAVKIFAGVHKSRSGKVIPTGTGRLCNWTPNQDGPDADEFQSFGAYQRTLTLICENGEPGIITWTPDSKTPDTVYYHCFTHRYLGWKIHVHDSCEAAEASEVDEVYAEPDTDFVAESSIRHETRIRPNDFLEKHEKDLIKHHNMAGKPPKVHFDIVKSNDITKLITDGIKAAEALEASLAKTRIPISNYPNLHTSAPEVLRGEMTSSLNLGKNTTTISYSNSKTVSSEIELPQEHIKIPNSAPSAYLRPPATAPLFRPVKTQTSNRSPPQKIPERRRPHRPSAPIVPQSSIIVNHYRKPIPSIMKPFVKEKPFPIQQIASVLMLGQPTELTPMQTEPLLKTKPGITNNIPVPYVDSIPQDSVKKYSLRNGPVLKHKIPFVRMPSYPEKPISKPVVYKQPFEIKEVQDSSEVLTLPPAVNTGFKEERVVVEGGFRPIVRRRTDDDVDDADRVNRRQDEVDAEIDEVMETDTLFLSQPVDPKDLSFEPMFIPSPPDSTNSSIIRKSIDLKNYHMRSGALIDQEPEAASAERLDIYYLPPDPKKRPIITPVVKTDGPVVVTYDGKPVLDPSLANGAPSNLDSSDEDVHRTILGISKTEQLIRSTPQFAPFRGEIPPPVPDVIPSDAPQLSKRGQQSHRPITEYSNPLSVELNDTKPISTKLTLLKSNSS